MPIIPPDLVRCILGEGFDLAMIDQMLRNIQTLQSNLLSDRESVLAEASRLPGLEHLIQMRDHLIQQAAEVESLRTEPRPIVLDMQANTWRDRPEITMSMWPRPDSEPNLSLELIRETVRQIDESIMAEFRAQAQRPEVQDPSMTTHVPRERSQLASWLLSQDTGRHEGDAVTWIQAGTRQQGRRSYHGGRHVVAVICTARDTRYHCMQMRAEQGGGWWCHQCGIELHSPDERHEFRYHDECIQGETLGVAWVDESGQRYPDGFPESAEHFEIVQAEESRKSPQPGDTKDCPKCDVGLLMWSTCFKFGGAWMPCSVCGYEPSDPEDNQQP